MVYEHDITVDVANTIDNPKLLYARLTSGIIHHYEIYFPPGCANLVHVTVSRGLHQLWPTNPDGTHKGEGTTLSYREYYDISKMPRILIIKAYNVGATYPHTITVRFAVLPRSIIAPWLLTWAEKLGLYAGGE